MPVKKEVTSKAIKSTIVSKSASVARGAFNEVYSVEGRYFFSDDKSILELPNLIEVQLDSYNDFLKNRLDRSFRETFPIQDFSGEKIDISYKGLMLDEPKYSMSDAKRKNLNYEAPLKIRLEMLNKESGEIKEQDVYMGGIPLMTDKGTFIVNGIERVIVNQIIRSTGVFFVPDAKHAGYYAMKIIPAKGSWFEIEIEKRGIINVKIDKKRKIPVTVLLRAFGIESDAEILAAFKGNKEAIANHIGPTIEKDKTKTRMEALYTIYKLLRPGDLGTDERVLDLFNATFLNTKRFDLGEVARIKIGRKTGRPVEYNETTRFLSGDDLISGLQYLMGLVFEEPGHHWDDIDHLENRRVRSVGELVYDKVKVGLARIGQTLGLDITGDMSTPEAVLRSMDLARRSLPHTPSYTWLARSRGLATANGQMSVSAFTSAFRNTRTSVKASESVTA